MILIGIAGGTGSGKTTVARKIQDSFPSEQVALISQDSYYKRAPKGMTIEQLRKLNYDHPDAFEWDLLCRHLSDLRAGRAVDVPTYSVLTCDRMEETVHVEPCDVVIVEGRFLNVTAVPTLRENIDKCFEQVGLKIANHTISTLALGDSILSESERRSGCALVDMGADTTTVAIYKNNILRQLSVIPLGGSNVTKDIMTLQLERDEAEQLKLKYGTAYAEFADDEEPSTITLSDGRTVDELTFLELTEARIEEIIVNVASQIKRSGYAKDKLLAGIVITGGVAATKNLERAFREHTDFEQFRFAKNLPITVRLPQGQESIKLGNVNTVIALVDKGTENCCGTPATTTTPVDLFSGHEGTSKDPAAETHARHGQKTDTTTKLHGKESDESEEELTDEKPRKKKQKKTHDGPTFKERCSKFWQSISRIVTDDSDPNLLDKDKNQ